MQICRSMMSIARYRIYTTLFATLGVLIVTGESLPAQDWSAVRQKVEDSLVFIETTRQREDGTNREVLGGTAFIFSNRGFAITAAHVVPRKRDGEVVEYKAAMKSRHAHKFAVQVVMRIEDLDLALIQFPSIGAAWKPVEFGQSSKVPADARLYVLGFPGSSDLASAEGLLSNHFGSEGKWQTTLPLDYGHSGGPVFDIGGKVVGVAAGGFDHAKARTFVVPGDYTLMIRSIVTAMSVGTPNTARVAFAFTVDSAERKELAYSACLEPGKTITSVTPRVSSRSGDGTGFITEFIRVPGRPNCFESKAFVAGKGVDRVGPIIVNQKGRGWLSGEFEVRYAQ